MNESRSIAEIVRKSENSYVWFKTRLGKYVQWQMHDTIETIDAYLNSKHISGSTDSLGREKPFFNMCSAAVNIWYRATDIDRKDIKLRPENSEETAIAFVATCHLQEWMIKERFGVFLNEWGRSLARYGSSMTKFVKQDGRLIPSVLPWIKLIVDPVDVNAQPIIEKFYMTPSQLRMQKGYDKEVVEKLIKTRTYRRNLEKQNVDIISEFIELYEVHGELPVALLKNPDERKEEDWKNYTQQMHVVSYLATTEGHYEDFTVFKGKEEKSPYMLTHLIKEDNRTLSIGAVEYLFDAQWMVNHTVKQMKDYLDIASKIIFQTSDEHFLGRNILKNIESGDIMIYKTINGGSKVEPINSVGANHEGILSSYFQMWHSAAMEITNTPGAMRGITMPSQTAYRQASLMVQEAGLLFELMTENKGLAIEDMMREFVIPYLKTKMNNAEEIATTLDEAGISEIDAMYIPRKAIKQYNDRTKKTVLQNVRSFLDKKPQTGILSPYHAPTEQANVKQSMSVLGNKRFFKPDEIDTVTWNKILKDFEWTCRVIVTDEMQDEKAALGTLTQVLGMVGQNPAILQDPNMRMIFGKILEITGTPVTISPLQLQNTPQLAQQPNQPQPNGGANNLPANLTMK